MTKRYFFIFGLSLIVIAWIALAPCVAQQSESDIHVVVNMVQVNVAVTDDKGNYVTGLHPEDFLITEDGITEKIATFEEGNGPARRVEADMDAKSGTLANGDSPASVGDATGSLASDIAGSDVFI